MDPGESRDHSPRLLHGHDRIRRQHAATFSGAATLRAIVMRVTASGFTMLFNMKGAPRIAAFG